MSGAPLTLEGLSAEQRFDSQLALVREHWASVRRLWLDDPDFPAGGSFRSSLPHDFWIGAGMPGLATVTEFGHRSFEFAEDGRAAVIIPAYDTIPGLLGTNPEAHAEHLTDLIAVDLDHSDRFWRRRGDALVLGAAYLEIAGQEREPVPVFKTPMSWLRSVGAGVVVLDWEWVPDLLLGLDLIAEDVDLGERLEAALKPNIWIGRVAA